MISSTLTCIFFSPTSICASRSTCSFAVDVYVLPATAPGPVNGLAPRLGVCAFVLECGSIFPILPWCICRQCLASAGLSRFPHGPSVGAILPQCSLGSPLPLPCPMCRFHFDNPPSEVPCIDTPALSTNLRPVMCRSPHSYCFAWEGTSAFCDGGGQEEHGRPRLGRLWSSMCTSATSDLCHPLCGEIACRA